MWHYVEDVFISLGYLCWGYLLGVLLSLSLFGVALNLPILALCMGGAYLMRTKLD